MEQTATKNITHKGIQGIIKLTLFTGFNEEGTPQGEYMNRVQGWYGDNENEPMFGVTVPQSDMDGAIKTIEDNIKLGIEDWHVGNQKPIIDELIAGGFQMENESMEPKEMEEEMSDLIVEDESLKEKVEVISASKNGNEPIESVDDVDRTIVVETKAEVDDW